MQTILGSNGPIGHELALELRHHYTQHIRLVSRHPKKINPDDELISANMLNYAETKAAIAGSEIVYFTIGLPMDTQMWEDQFLIMLANVIKACQEQQSKLVFFDNTYMYPKNATVQTENSPFTPTGRKAMVRAKMATMLLKEMKAETLTAVICRAPEFYGPKQTNSITNTMFFKNIRDGHRGKIPINDQTLRTLIWTPDASRAMALIGNTPDCYGQTWHLPTDRSISYREIVHITAQIIGHPVKTNIIPLWQFKLGALFNHQIQELAELLPRYQFDNLFSATKFKQHFPDFKITTIEQGIESIFGH